MKADVKQKPKNFGWEFARWIGQRILIHMIYFFAKTTCLRTVYNYMHKNRLKRLKLRKKFAKAKPEVIEAFKEEHLQLVANLGIWEIIVYLDEASIQFCTTISYVWAEIGKPEEREVLDNSSYKCQGIMGAVDPQNDIHLAQFITRGNAAVLIKFLTDLLAHYTKLGYVKLFVVLDNAKFHHAKKVTAFMKQQDGALEMIYIPPYSPQLMPEEKIWFNLRAEVTHNQYYEKEEEKREAIRRYLHNLKWSGQGVQSWCGYYLPEQIMGDQQNSCETP